MQDKTLYKRILDQIHRWLTTESTISNSLAVLIGISTGFVIVIYDRLLEASNHIFFGSVAGHPHYYVIFLPALGGLLVGIITYIFVKRTRCDVEEVIEASALHGGKLRVKKAFLEVLLSIISIGSGGSVGKEVPGVLAGAGIGSAIAQTFRISGNRLKVLLGCGASGGIAAAFNAPLAGVVFVVEVIFGELETKTFIPIVISSVFATLVSNFIFGIKPIEINYGLVSPFNESLLYLTLGILAGIVSVSIIRFLYLLHDVFERIPVHSVFKPALGGLGVGIIGFLYPQIFGMGYDVISEVLTNKLALNLMLVLLLLKIIAFSLTLGSGGAGGSIVPSLFIGAMLGGAFGTVVHTFLPIVTSEPGAYALVGMGAVFTGTARAPLTAILILFEVTMDYNLILPLMLACVISNVVSSSLHPQSIFTEGLKRRGFTISKGHEVDIMESMFVRDVMESNVQTISENESTGALVLLIQTSRHAGFPVLDADNRLVGIVTLQDVRDKVKYGELERKVGDIASRDPIVAYPDESLDIVLKRFALRDIGRLPVVSRVDEKKLLGVITRSDIVKSYNKKVVSMVHEKMEAE